MRLDSYLAEKGFTKSRTKAAELISCGKVTVDGKVVTKPSFDIKENSSLDVTVNDDSPFVGRGGIKLEGAIEAFGISAEGKICADIGASTGGFTDCLLSHGAARVYAVDSGHGQLEKKLADDSRVVNLEGCNARYLDESVISEKCALAVCDLSFVSQTLVIPTLKKILSEGGELVTLVKPQFECGREALGKNGVVKDKKQHILALRKVVSCLRENGFAAVGLIKSPIKGGEGNMEFLIHARLGNGTEDCVDDKKIKETAL